MDNITIFLLVSLILVLLIWLDLELNKGEFIISISKIKLKPDFKMTFNIKAFKYAMQYVAYPTCFFVLLVFLWFLDIHIMYDWIKSENTFPSICRLVIFFIELLIFYNVYNSKCKELEELKVIKNAEEGNSPFKLLGNVQGDSLLTRVKNSYVYFDQLTYRDRVDIHAFEKVIDSNERMYVIKVKKTETK